MQLDCRNHIQYIRLGKLRKSSLCCISAQPASSLLTKPPCYI